MPSRKKVLLTYLLAAAAAGCQLVRMYIGAVNAGFIVETSLGYFINPLVNVLLGTVLLARALETRSSGCRSAWRRWACCT
jgi:chloramphenicol-sensitive protein RarD